MTDIPEHRYDKYYDYLNDEDYGYTLGNYHWLRIMFSKEVLLKTVKLMPIDSGDLLADSICVYAGLTATDSVGCINREDEFEDYTLFSIEAQMIPTQQILIAFNGSWVGAVRQLEFDYYYKGQQII